MRYLLVCAALLLFACDGDPVAPIQCTALLDTAFVVETEDDDVDTLVVIVEFCPERPVVPLIP